MLPPLSSLRTAMARYTPGRSLTRSRKTPFVFDRSTPTPRHPPGVVTAIGAVGRTFAGDRVLRSTVKLADAPLKVTALAPMNPVPMMVTEERYG